MYYRVKPKLIDDTVMIDDVSDYDISLTLGEVLSDDVPGPIEFMIDTDINNFSYLPVTFLSEPVFSNELIEALKNIGVDNFDTYEVRIFNPETDEEIDGYKAVNIIGKVSCADMDASECDRLIEDQYVFRKLVIDPSRAHGLYLFRLAEWTQVILIHESVVNKLPPHLVKDFELEPVEEKTG